VRCIRAKLRLAAVLQLGTPLGSRGGSRLKTLHRPLGALTLGALLAGCAPSAQQHYLSDPAARQQYLSNLTPEKCRALQSVISARQIYGIVAPSMAEDQAALERCPQAGVETGISPPATSPSAATDLPSTEEITIEKHGDTYTVPVRINGTITLPFVLDTGATDLVIPLDVALTLVRAGALTRQDLIGESRYSLANGSEEVGDRVRLREVQVGQHTVRNVTAVVNPPASDLLLGQSFLSKFGAVTLDYKRLVLVLSR
jgi:clan AA aspartic protease (TIGR02281 family)